MKANYHTHTIYCGHAIGNVNDYVDEAIKNHFNILGMSDHAPFDLDYFKKLGIYDEYHNQRMSMTAFIDSYIKEVEETKLTYKDKIKIYLGLETEYLDDDKEYYEILKEKVEYMILGVHFFPYNNEIFDIHRPIYKDGINGYFDTAIRALNSGLFKIFAHPYIFLFNYYGDNGRGHLDDLTIKRSKEMIECAIKNDVALEINLNGIYMSDKYNIKGDYLYPKEEFFKLVAYYKDAKVIIGYDAHDPALLSDKYYLEALKFIDRLGIKVVDTIDI